MKPFSSNLWIGQSRMGETNCGIWTSDGLACLIDPGVHSDEIQAIAAFCRERGHKPQVIAITHYHWDHVLGPAHFRSVPVVAHVHGLVEVARRGKLVRAYLVREGYVPADPAFQFPLPDCEVRGEQAIQIGQLTLWAIPLPGHASDQIGLYEPNTATLWAADMLSDIEAPFIMDSLLDYENSLRRLCELSIEALIPGHGKPTCDPRDIQGRIRRDLAYVTGIRAGVERSLASGHSLEETVAAHQELQKGMPIGKEGYRMNLETAYVELGGEAEGEVGWERGWKALA
jgi:glyoxylase-like metal-dependent hydrolase (beta-lactamase superfamily II)